MNRWTWTLLALAFAAPVFAVAARATAAPPSIRGVTPIHAHGKVTPRFAKLELEVDLAAAYHNPFDPDEIDVAAEFTAPSGRTYAIWGFFHPTSAKWLVRFAPTEAGRWRYVVTVRDRAGVAESAPGEFRCVESVYPGFVRIAPNRRYFQYTSGASFYGVGLWFNDQFTGAAPGAISEDALDRLRALGVNFISFYPSLLETRRTGLGRYDAARADRLDQLVAWCDERDLHISWNLVFHDHIAEHVWEGGDWAENPYSAITRARDFFASDAAWRHEEKLYRYVIARWGYSRSIFLWFVVDEINGTEGWTEGDRDAALAWCRRMNDFFHVHDPYGRPTTGTQSGGVDQWWPEGYAIFDVAGRELYEAQGHPMPLAGNPNVRLSSLTPAEGEVRAAAGVHPLTMSSRNYAKQVRDLWAGFAKPAIIAETGYDHTYYEPGTPGYLATYHNALWATLATGGAATPFWWCYLPEITDGLLTHHVRAFAEFVREIDFAHRDWRPQPVDASAGDAWAMRAGRHAFGWAVNPAAGVARETITLPGVPIGPYDILIYCTWRGEFLPPIPVAVTDGRLTFAIPELHADDGHALNIGDDVAFRIIPRDEEP